VDTVEIVGIEGGFTKRKMIYWHPFFDNFSHNLMWL